MKNLQRNMLLFNFTQKCHNVIEWYNKCSITFLSKGLKTAVNYIHYEVLTNELPQPDIFAIFICSTGIPCFGSSHNWTERHIYPISWAQLGTSGNNEFHHLNNANQKSTTYCQSCFTKAYSSFMWIMKRGKIWMQHWRDFHWGEQFLLDMV